MFVQDISCKCLSQLCNLLGGKVPFGHEMKDKAALVKDKAGIVFNKTLNGIPFQLNGNRGRVESEAGFVGNQRSLAAENWILAEDPPVYSIHQ